MTAPYTVGKQFGIKLEMLRTSEYVVSQWCSLRLLLLIYVGSRFNLDMGIPFKSLSLGIVICQLGGVIPCRKIWWWRADWGQQVETISRYEVLWNEELSGS